MHLFFRINLNASSLLLHQSLHTTCPPTLDQPREACTLPPTPPEVNSIDHLPVPVFGFQLGPLVCLFTHKPVLISANKGLMDSFCAGAARYTYCTLSGWMPHKLTSLFPPRELFQESFEGLPAFWSQKCAELILVTGKCFLQPKKAPSSESGWGFQYWMLLTGQTQATTLHLDTRAAKIDWLKSV